MWLLGSSAVLEEADLATLGYSGLLPLQPALPAAVERCARASLRWLTLSKCVLPVRTLVGLPASPGSARAGGAIGSGALSLGATGSLLASSGFTSAVTSAGGGATSVEALELKWQRVCALDATLIARLLEHNRQLTRIDLSWNSDLSSGAAALATALGASRTLRDIDLSETSLGDLAADDFCRAMAENRSLTRLSLRGCGIGADARAALERAAARRLQPFELVL